MGAMCEACEYDTHVEVGFVQEMEIYSGAEDVKTVRFIGDRGAVDVDITDDTMREFLEVAERVNHQIWKDMEEIQRILDGDSSSVK